jgi:DNA repair exonuclease SbcCD ATPase subunit
VVKYSLAPDGIIDALQQGESTMSDTTELAVIPKETALEAFSADRGLEPYLAKIRAEIDSFVPDISTKKGRDAIASIAFKVAKSKTYLDGVGKDLVAELKELPKKIDASRKEMRDTLDAWKEEVRKPLTDWELAEEARIKAHTDAIQSIKDQAAFIEGLSAADLSARAEFVQGIELGDRWEEFAAKAAEAKDAATIALAKAIEARKQYEAEQAELARLRAEAEARAQKEREEAIAREAAEQERIKAEKAAQAERDAVASREAEAKAAAERRELELRLAAEKAEREKLEAQQAAVRAEQEAQRRAEEAAQAERDKLAKEAAQAAADAAAREKDKAHKAVINNAAMAAFIAGGMTKECAKLAVTLIAKKSIPSVTIAY